MLKNFWVKIKPVLIAAFWIGCAGGLTVLLGASVNHQQQLYFHSIEVNIDERNGMLFLSKDDIVNILQDDQVNAAQSKPISDVNYRKLERAISNNPYVESAELFVDANGNIRIDIEQRTPILRVINNKGVGYYIDKHSGKMPLSSKFTARVPVATGNVWANPENENHTDSATVANLFTLASYISSDSFLTSLTEQIIVNEQKEFAIVPCVGNHLILLGNADQLDEKFNKLKIFYKEGLKQAAGNDYSVVNLKYENEVYCTKRNAKASPAGRTDSTRSINPL